MNTIMVKTQYLISLRRTCNVGHDKWGNIRSSKYLEGSIHMLVVLILLLQYYKMTEAFKFSFISIGQQLSSKRTNLYGVIVYNDDLLTSFLQTKH